MTHIFIDVSIILQNKETNRKITLFNFLSFNNTIRHVVQSNINITHQRTFKTNPYKIKLKITPDLFSFNKKIRAIKILKRLIQKHSE